MISPSSHHSDSGNSTSSFNSKSNESNHTHTKTSRSRRSRRLVDYRFERAELPSRFSAPTLEDLALANQQQQQQAQLQRNQGAHSQLSDWSNLSESKRASVNAAVTARQQSKGRSEQDLMNVSCSSLFSSSTSSCNSTSSSSKKNTKRTTSRRIDRKSVV